MLYVQLGHVMEGFVTQTSSFISLFRALFGDFDIDEIMNNSRGYLNTCLFLVYLFVAVFILLSMFLALLAEVSLCSPLPSALTSHLSPLTAHRSPSHPQAQVAVREREAEAKEDPSYREFGVLSHSLDAAYGCKKRLLSGRAEASGEESEGAEGAESPNGTRSPSPQLNASATDPAAASPPARRVAGTSPLCIGAPGCALAPQTQGARGGSTGADGSSPVAVPEIGSDEALSIMVNEIRKLQGQIELLRSQVGEGRRSEGRRGEGRRSEGRAAAPAKSPVLRPDTRMMPVWTVASESGEPPALTFPTFSGGFGGFGGGAAAGGGGASPGPRMADYRERSTVSLNA